MIIRRATEDDIDDIVKLWREMWDFHSKFDPRFVASPFADQVMKDWIEDHLNRAQAVVLVAERSGQIVGYLLGMILQNPPIVPYQIFGYISEIAVAESERRKGTGKLLVEEAHRWFKKNYVTYVEVNVSINNAVSRGFWRKMGYGEWLERLRFEL